MKFALDRSSVMVEPSLGRDVVAVPHTTLQTARERAHATHTSPQQRLGTLLQTARKIPGSYPTRCQRLMTQPNLHSYIPQICEGCERGLDHQTNKLISALAYMCFDLTEYANSLHEGHTQFSSRDTRGNGQDVVFVKGLWARSQNSRILINLINNVLDQD